MSAIVKELLIVCVYLTADSESFSGSEGGINLYTPYCVSVWRQTARVSVILKELLIKIPLAMCLSDSRQWACEWLWRSYQFIHPSLYFLFSFSDVRQREPAGEGAVPVSHDQDGVNLAQRPPTCVPQDEALQVALRVLQEAANVQTGQQGQHLARLLAGWVWARMSKQDSRVSTWQDYQLVESERVCPNRTA